MVDVDDSCSYRWTHSPSQAFSSHFVYSCIGCYVIFTSYYFIFTVQRYVSAIYAVIVCLSVTLYYCIKTAPCMCVLITNRWQSVSQCALNIARSVCCLVISIGVQDDMVDFVWGSVARSISISRYTCSIGLLFRNLWSVISNPLLLSCSKPALTEKCMDMSQTCYVYVVDMLI